MTIITTKDGRRLCLESVEAYENIDPEERQREVLEFLKEYPRMIAPQLTDVMRKKGRRVQYNGVSACLSDLKKAGKVKVVGKRLNPKTNCMCSVFVASGHDPYAMSEATEEAPA